MDSWWKAIKWVMFTLLSGVLFKLAVKIWGELGSPFTLDQVLASLKQHDSLVSWVVSLSVVCGLLWLFADRKETLEQLKQVTFFVPSRDLVPNDLSISRFHPYFQSSAEAARAQQELSTTGRVLILGRPASGKTRLAYSLAKREERYWVLRLQPDFNESKPLVFSRIPPRCKVLWIIDDLDKFLGRLDLVQVARVLKGQCDLKIVVTCRNGQELALVRANNELAAFIEPLLPGTTCPNFSEADLLSLAEKTGMPLDSSRYDGTPGSVTLGLDKMRRRLQSATSEEQALMKAMFLLRTALIY